MIFFFEVILEEDHYGVIDVKERILEFIAIAKIKGSLQVFHFLIIFFMNNI